MTYIASQAQSGRGSQLAIGSGTPVVIGEVSDLPFDRPEWTNVDVTNFQSGSDEEVLPTIRKTASFTFKGNRVSSDAGQTAVETAYQSGALASFTCTLPKTATQTTSGDKYTFNAYVLGSNFAISPTKQIEFSIKLQTSGAVTETPGT